MKNPSNYPIKSFARLKKISTLIFKKSVALIVNIEGRFVENEIHKMIIGAFRIVIIVACSVSRWSTNVNGIVDQAQPGPTQCPDQQLGWTSPPLCGRSTRDCAMRV